MRLTVTGFLFLLLTTLSFAQTGIYDVRFNLNTVDCANSEIFIDIEVKAADAGSTFNISEQNYRFSFNREAVANPRIAQELTLSGPVSDPNGDFSAFNAHTLNGSADTVVSYNVELAFGPGYFVSTEWIPVGRLAFDILDASECLELIWHTHAPEDFPPTFIGEKFNDNLYEADENLYENNSICFGPFCLLPIELSEFYGKDENCTVLLNWNTLSETNNDYFEIQKSLDGKNYSKIGIVAGQGNSDVPTSYSFRDADVNSENYYRLKQVDLDGSFSYSDEITVQSACFEDVNNGIKSLYPNPVSTELVNIKFYINQADQNARIKVSDVAGRLVQELPIEVEQGENLIHFNPAELANGSYFIQIIGDNWFSAPEKLIKINE